MQSHYFSYRDQKMLKTTMVPSDLAKVVINTQVTTATVQTYHNGDIQNLLAAVSGSGL